jgi:hypothetical protein
LAEAIGFNSRFGKRLLELEAINNPQENIYGGLGMAVGCDVLGDRLEILDGVSADGLYPESDWADDLLAGDADQLGLSTEL